MSNPVIASVGNKRWFNSKGQFHRLDGPAFEGIYGNKSWWVDGKRHRLDGPAIDWSDGSKGWWIDGDKVTESEYPEAILLYKCKQVLES
jgi:hypothetical protein